MTYRKKLLVAGLLVFTSIVPNLQSVSAATPDYSTLSPEVRAAVLAQLIQQLTVLQAKFKELQAAQTSIPVATQPTPRAVTVDDYVRGSATAPIQIITFTDLDCPYCKQFHTTLNTILAAHSDVAAIYRHFPLVQIHPNAKNLAIAAECVGQLGGDTAFWKFVDSVFASRTDLGQKTDMTKLPAFAVAAGVSESAFETCRLGTAANDAVEADMADGQKSGVQGTPMSFVLSPGHPVSLITGAQPQSVVESVITALEK